MVTRACLRLALAATAGCLEPLVDDAPGASLHVLPPGSAVPYVSADAELERQIRVNDGLADAPLEAAGGVIALKTATARGAAVRYWDLGDAPETGAPLYRLVRREGDAVTPVDHRMIADTLPGDTRYSPFRYLQDVVVTSAYRGEVLPSTDAIADAVELGLVEAPVPALLFVDGPIVPLGTRLALGDDLPPQEAVSVYVRGHQVAMLLVGGIVPLARAGRLPRGDVHRVWIGNAVSPRAEPTFQNPGAPFTPAVRVIESRVADSPDPIDDDADLFVRDTMGNLTVATPRVTSFVVTTAIKNWPIFVQVQP